LFTSGEGGSRIHDLLTARNIILSTFNPSNVVSSHQDD